MKSLTVVLMVLASVAMPITLQYGDYKEGDDIFHRAASFYLRAVWFDLDSLGYDSFRVDSVEIGFTAEVLHWDPWFCIEIWPDNNDTNHDDPDGNSVWESGWLEAQKPSDTVPYLQRFTVDYDESISNHI